MRVISKSSVIAVGVLSAVGLVALAMAANTGQQSDPKAKSHAEHEAHKAQKEHGSAHQGHCGQMKARFAEELGLSEDQIQRIQAIKEKAKQFAKSATPEERKAKWAELKAELDSVLTPEQRAKLAELKASIKEHAGKWKQHFSDALGLSEAQVERLKALKEKFKAELRASTPEDRKQSIEKFRSEVESILTPEQRAKLVELKAKHKIHREKVRKTVHEDKSSTTI
ncbi:MAG: hypothetical protein AKCLJLPJ_01847 [Fimbriimonadales bacterium]|nr:hypothetical protein [Fimbriimonadales bacterium]